MTIESKQELFTYMANEHGVTLLESDMKEIEYKVSVGDIQLLNKCQAELRAMYSRLGYQSSNILMAIDQRLSEFPKEFLTKKQP